MKYIIFSLCVFYSFTAWSGPHTATLVFKRGDVQFLTDPTKKAKGTGQEVLFQSLYFKIKKARLGGKLKPGDALKVGPDGKAKVNFGNGDHFMVDAGTTYRIEKSNKVNKGKKDGSVLNLYYGKLRGIVSKNGARKNMKIRTPSAVAGVRGTDFYVAAAPEGTEVTVLRGKVAIEEVDGKKEEVVVRKGMTAVAQVEEPKSETTKAAPPKVIQVKEATKTELIEIQRVSSIDVKKELEETTEEVPKELMAEIKSLEKKAVKIVIDDIKVENPEAAEKLAKANVESTTDINTSVVSDLYKKAPEAPKAKKLTEDELNAIGEDVYKKYFSN